jgi:hypothetical protein
LLCIHLCCGSFYLNCCLNILIFLK